MYQQFFPLFLRNIDTPQFVYVFTVDGHLGVSSIDNVTKTDLKVYIQVFVWKYAFFSLRQIPRSGMALSYGRLCLSILKP